MKTHVEFQTPAGMGNVNLSGDTSAWNCACLNFAETAPMHLDVGRTPTPDRMEHSGYAANISPATQEWNGSCLDFGGTKLGAANNTPEGIRQPAHGLPKPSA